MEFVCMHGSIQNIRFYVVHKTKGWNESLWNKYIWHRRLCLFVCALRMWTWVTHTSICCGNQDSFLFIKPEVLLKTEINPFCFLCVINTVSACTCCFVLFTVDIDFSLRFVLFISYRPVAELQRHPTYFNKSHFLWEPWPIEHFFKIIFKPVSLLVLYF